MTKKFEPHAIFLSTLKPQKLNSIPENPIEKRYRDSFTEKDKDYLTNIDRCCKEEGLTNNYVVHEIHISDQFDGKAIEELSQSLWDTDPTVVIDDTIYNNPDYVITTNILKALARSGLIKVCRYIPPTEKSNGTDKWGKLIRLENFDDVFDNDFGSFMTFDERRVSKDYEYGKELRNFIDLVIKPQVEDYYGNAGYEDHAATVDISYYNRNRYLVTLAILKIFAELYLIKLPEDKTFDPKESVEYFIQEREMYLDPIEFAFKQMKERAEGKSSYV